MKINHRISCAVVAILSSHAAAVRAGGDNSATAATEPTTGGGASGEVAEVIVTAQRRAESSQNVPITLQTLTSETLNQLNVTTLEDYVRYLPNVSFAGNGPSQGEIYMRGLSTGESGVQGSGSLGSFPNVALYLDDQSAQVPGRNLDIYAADLERIEILEGPQGTLFGAGAEAGVVRYITNKPKLNVTEFLANGGAATTAHGRGSADVDAALNIPLVQDRLAVRAAAYVEDRGGYINNIPATFARAPTDLVSVNYFCGHTPPNSGPINNYPEAGRAINPVTYKGIRGELLYQVNDDWNALLTQMYQDLDAEGVAWEEQYDGVGQTLPPLSVELFNPTDLRDKFTNTALTVNGRISALQFVYTGAYLNRTSDQVSDYTNYSRGVFAGYYQCNYPGYPFKTPLVNGVATPTPGSFTQSNLFPGVGVSPGFCYSPRVFWTDYQTNTHNSQEMRLSTPDDWRLRGLLGLFWENYSIKETVDWDYGTSPNFQPIAPPPGAAVINPDVRQAGDVFFNDITRGYRQRAAFASVDFDLLPKTLTLTYGSRYYHIENFEYGANVGSFGCEINGPYNGAVPPNPCGVPESNGTNLNLENLDKTYTGFRSRANLSWHVTPDTLLYYTWSQGFRPGGFNRAASVVSTTSPLYGIFTPPLAYGPDKLTNNEVGFKTEWFGRTLQWNGAIYQEKWYNTQITIFDPGVTGNLTFTTNGPDYRVRGAETSLLWRATTGLTFTGSGAWNSSEVVRTLALVNPMTGQPINIANPFGTLGQPLANSPPFEGNVRARYEVPLGDYHSFVQVGANRLGGSYATTDHLTKTLQGQSVAFYVPGFTTYNASLGVGRDNWNVQLYCDNLSDSRGYAFSFYTLFVKADTVIRPRTAGLRFNYAWSQPK
jgi:iron complex outermembrane recepter protein